MITLTLEGQIRQEGNHLVIDTQVIEMESIEQALAEIERQRGRPTENWDAQTIIGNDVWAVI